MKTFSKELAEATKPIFEEALQSEEARQEIIESIDAFILTRADRPKTQMIFREIKRVLSSDDFRSAVKSSEVKK